MRPRRVIVKPDAAADVESVGDWYDTQRLGLRAAFLDDLEAPLDRVGQQPLLYQILRGGIRRAMLHDFPYAVFFVAEPERVTVLAVVHLHRDPQVWQRRRP